MSTTYRGDPRLRENYSAAIPPNQSTSLVIKDLPANTTIPRIMKADAIEHVRAYHSIIRRPLNNALPNFFTY